MLTLGKKFTPWLRFLLLIIKASRSQAPPSFPQKRQTTTSNFSHFLPLSALQQPPPSVYPPSLVAIPPTKVYISAPSVPS